MDAFSLMLWVSLTTGMDMPPTVPPIVYANALTLARLGPEQDQGFETAALYFKGTIYLPREPVTHRELGMLAHELTHVLQIHNGVTYECVGTLEAQAYAVEAEWLAFEGLSLEDTEMVAGLSAC